MYDLPGAYIKDLVELASRWPGVTAKSLLGGLPVGDLGDPGTRVPLRVCEAIAQRALEQTHEPALAIHVGIQMRLSVHGFLGFAAMTAATVREALELACRFASTRTSAIELGLYVEGDTASVVIHERTPLGDTLRELIVLALMIGVRQLGATLTGRELEGVGECAFPEPPYMRNVPHGARLKFGRAAHRLVFEAKLLDLPLVSADPIALKLAREQCERELASVVDAGLPSRVRAMLDTTQALGDVAKKLKLSERTLKRKLAEHGTTFSTLRDEHRRQRALLMLDNRTLSISDIATKLGYSELPNFTRAFRKWVGVTPQAYRDRSR